MKVEVGDGGLLKGERWFWWAILLKGERGKRYTKLVLSLVKEVEKEDEEEERVDLKKN